MNSPDLLRRLLLGFLLVACGLSTITSSVMSVSAAAQDSNNSFEGVEIPPDIGQTDMQVYVKATRHTVRGSMLDYWRANGASAVYGNPISEPFADDNGRYSQAFEGGIFQYYAEYLFTDDPTIRLMPLGSRALDERVDTVRRDGRRGFGGGDSRHSAWKALPADSRAVQRAYAEGGIYSEVTGHTITREFLTWYQSHEGGFYLGNPISQPVRERGVTVQYFEGALLVRDDDGVVSVAPLAREMAESMAIDTSAVEQGNLPLYSEERLVTKPNPNPLGSLDAPGRKRIEISISQQSLWAYQGDTLIMQTLVSTGLSPNDTETGLFHVRLKYPKQDMAGFESSSGEVVGFAGEDRPSDGVNTYEVKDVPNVMYFNMDAEALHGAYWHNNFGNRMSHGCINLPLNVAEFMYEWAPLGTMVWVYD